MQCHHADSGCNYPEGECAGLCMAGATPMYYHRLQPVKPNHTVRRFATVLGFMSIGIVAAVLMHDYTHTIERENDALRALNMQLLRDADTELHCKPHDENSKAVMLRVNGDLRCEIHTIRKGI